MTLTVTHKVRITTNQGVIELGLDRTEVRARNFIPKEKILFQADFTVTPGQPANDHVKALGPIVLDQLKLDFDRRLMVQFRGSVVTSDAGLLAYRELDDALGLSALAREMLADARTGKNGRHALVGLLRQSVFGRLAGYEDVNDAERLRHDPAMRWIIGGNAAYGRAASPSQMGRFETQWLATDTNLAGLIDLSGQWIDLVHRRRPSRSIVLDMDSSVSPTHGEQVLVCCPDLDRLVRMLGGFFGHRVGKLFLKAASSSGVADFGFLGRGDWIDQPMALSASHPRCAASSASPSSAAIQRATLPLVQRPPSGGGSVRRSFSFASSPAVRTDGMVPLLRRRSPSASGPNAL